ncbi:hypothetical protein TGCAST_268835 [Toxoplasma gondii CAST]|uniref:Uncharacterized protein n=1 Tax=Toxoplasma gondii CAST TaxID=943122 RepID=A0A3R7ZDN0_TOXGO|nr:hypothetical protein TGCAST_268835 [Toxoplasma gondii CAST]
MQRRRTKPLKGKSGRVKNRESVKAAKSPPRTPRTRETQQLEKRLKADTKRRTGTCTLHSNKSKQQYSDAQYEDTGDKCTSAFFSSVYKPVRAILFCLYSHSRRDRHPGESLDFYKALPVVVKILFFAEISMEKQERRLAPVLSRAIMVSSFALFSLCNSIARGGRRLVRSLSNKKSFYGSKPHDGLASWPSPESGYREFT